MTATATKRMVSVVGTCPSAPQAYAGPDVHTTREQRDRIRSAWLCTWGREPGTTAASSIPGGDLAAAVALLVWEGRADVTATEFDCWGTVSLDGTVLAGVVSSGYAARPVRHLRDLLPALVELNAAPLPQCASQAHPREDGPTRPGSCRPDRPDLTSGCPP